MRVVAIVQARMGSTRLPGKVLRQIAGRSMLEHVIVRLRRARCIDEITIATTRKMEDDQIEEFCRSLGVQCFRGDDNDVLDRYYEAAKRLGASTVVRVTSDCPLIDPGIADRVIRRFNSLVPDIDYVSNILPPRSFPRGLDIEVFSLEALERAWEEDTSPATREHVTPFIWRNPDQFMLDSVAHEIDCSSLRWTVDTMEDLRLVEEVYNYFGHNRMTMVEILEACAQHPEWERINQHVRQKDVKTN